MTLCQLRGQTPIPKLYRSLVRDAVVRIFKYLRMPSGSCKVDHTSAAVFDTEAPSLLQDIDIYSRTVECCLSSCRGGEMGNAVEDPWGRLKSSFLAGYQDAAAANASAQTRRPPPEPIFHVASLLQEVATAQDLLQNRLEECRQAIAGVESLDADMQGIARAELQQNLKQLLTYCDRVSDHVRNSSLWAQPQQTAQDADQVKVEPQVKVKRPHSNTRKKRSHRR